MRRILGVLAMLLAAGTARADTPPSAWDRARDPDAADAYQVHKKIEQRLLSAPPSSRDRETNELHQREIQAVRAILENNRAASSKSALLRYDLAYVLDELKEFEESAKIYKATIAEFPDHPATERARLRLAFACGHFGDNQCELACYTKILQTESEEPLRATPLLNLAETYMHLGDLKEAITDYREAIRIAGRTGSNETIPLATWGLAVALDRSGDRLGAEREARFAVDLERSMNATGLLTSDGVFFFPEFELYWYQGLGEVARARAATRARDAATHWARAERLFAEYVRAAEPVHDRWVDIAKARLRQLKEEKAKAEKNIGREAPASAGPDVTL